MEQEKNFNELMDLVPSHVVTEFNLTPNQTKVLGQIIMLDGLDKTKSNGYSYRSNQDLANDCGLSTTGVVKCVNKLIHCNLIERQTGNRKDGASIYKLNTKKVFNKITDNKLIDIMNKNQNTKVTNEVTNKLPNELPILVINYLSDTLQVIDKLLNSYLTELPNEVTDKLPIEVTTDIDKDIDIYNNINNNILNKIDTIKNKIINNIKENSNNINNKIEEKENIINNIQEKESDREEETTEVDDNINSVQVEESKEMNQAELQQYAINKIKEYTKDGYSSEDLEEIRNKVNDELLQLKKDKVITQDSYNYVFGFQVLPTINKLYAELPTYDEKNIPIEDEVFEEVSIKEILDTKTIELPAVEETTTPTATPSSNMEEKFKLALDNFNNDGSRGQEAMDRRSIALKKLHDAKQDGSISEPFYKDCIHQLCVICSNKGL